jgi:multiple sugar transport system permease protein
MVLLGRVTRASLAVLAAVIVLWSFYRVLARPLEHARGRGDRTELTVLHWGDMEEDRIVRQLVATFEASHPDIRIRRINAPANYYAKLKTMFASGEPPDVMFLNARDIPTFAGMGLLMDVDPLMKADAARGGGGGADFNAEDFLKPTLDSFRFDGVTHGKGGLYGLPSNFTGLGFYYNKTLFKKAGVEEPNEHWTWEDFESKCREVAAKAPGSPHGCALELTGDSFRAVLETFGVELFSPDSKRFNVRDPVLRNVLERVRRWTIDEKASRAVSATDPYDDVNTGSGAFALQRAAMYGPTGRWMVPEFRNIKDFEWDFVPMPKGTRRGTVLYIAAWSLSSATKHPKEAWSLARHLATPEGQEQLARTGLAIPSLRSVATGPTFMDPKLPPEHDERFLMDVEVAWPSVWPPDSLMQRRFGAHLQDCLRLGRTSIAESLDAAERDWNDEQSSPLRTGTFRPAPWRLIGLIIGAVAAVVVGVVAVALLRWRPGRLRVREARAGYLMASPWVIGFLLFVLGPMVVSLALAFMRWRGLKTLDHAEWVGLLNFEQMFGHDPRFRNSLWLTVKYAALGVPVTQAAALIAAVLMHENVRGTKFFRALWYLPSVLAGAGMAVMWQWVFNGEHGLLNAAVRPLCGPVNAVLGWLGGLVGATVPKMPPDWIGADAEWAGVPAFVIAALWSIGGSMLIYLAGLQGIPQTLYEAAAIDGAGPVRRFLRVTLPMLSPVILFNVVIALIGSFQVFTMAYVMTKGGPGDSTTFYVLYLYNNAFESHEMGYASAMAWVLLVIIMALTGLVLWQGKKRVHYEGLRA